MARISLSGLSGLCHRVAESYKAGLDLRSIWNREAMHGALAYRVAARSVSDQLARGESLADAMQSCNGYYPSLTVAVARAGEQGGRLERAFKMLAEHYDSLLRFRRELLASIAWPMFELVGSVCVIGLLILIMGWVTAVSNAEPIDWLGFGWTTAQYFWAYVITVLTIAGAIVGFVYAVNAGWFGTAPLAFARNVPVLGATIEYLSLSRFAWALAIIVDSGMNLFDGVRMALRATQNYYYDQLGGQVADAIRAGRPVHEALRETRAFPAEFLMYVENGESTGQVPETMNQLAETYMERAKNNFRILRVVLFAICFAVVAIICALGIIFLYQRVILDQYYRVLEM